MPGSPREAVRGLRELGYQEGRSLGQAGDFQGRGHPLPGDPRKRGERSGKERPGVRDLRWSGVDPGSKQDPRPSAWEVPEKGPRTLALLSRSPTKVESSRDGDRGERGRSSLARAGKGAAGGSSGRVTVYEVRMLRSRRWAMPPNRRG